MGEPHQNEQQHERRRDAVLPAIRGKPRAADDRIPVRRVDETATFRNVRLLIAGSNG